MKSSRTEALLVVSPTTNAFYISHLVLHSAFHKLVKPI